MDIDLLLNQPNLSAIQFPFIEWSQVVSSLVVALLVGFSLAVTYLIVELVLQIKLYKSKHTILEVKPLRDTEQSAYTTQQLFNLFHSIGQQRSLAQRFFKVSKAISFEIVSQKDNGIRYLIRAGEDEADLIKKSLLSYLPGVKVSEVSEYLSGKARHSQIVEFALSNHFAFSS